MQNKPLSHTLKVINIWNSIPIHNKRSASLFSLKKLLLLLLSFFGYLSSIQFHRLSHTCDCKTFHTYFQLIMSTIDQKEDYFVKAHRFYNYGNLLTHGKMNNQSISFW